MSDEALWLDGNAIAGLLIEVLGAELTATEHGCKSCGALTRLGAHRVYRSAGTVVRCPVCGDLVLRITTLPDRHVVHLTGTWALEVPR
ncbi:MAG TPA: DUF6510 family protein [Solirubrobacteraceae bacterium]|jgi:hypothetical protein|nr:DUF6510 family protein [Solirubrobacteraceae bacterium]